MDNITTNNVHIITKLLIKKTMVKFISRHIDEVLDVRNLSNSTKIDTSRLLILVAFKLVRMTESLSLEECIKNHTLVSLENECKDLVDSLTQLHHKTEEIYSILVEKGRYY